MAWFIVLIGALLMVKGAALILIPRKVIHLAQKMLVSKQIKRLSVAQMVLGLLLCASARFSYLALGVFLLGLLCIAKGAYIFITPLDKLKKHKIFSLTEKIYRVIGIIVLVVGMILINSAV